MAAWGFEYKTTAFTWVKTNPKSGTPFFGLGRWTRGNKEDCLLGVKGKPHRADKGVFSLMEDNRTDVLYHPVMRHSAKPSTVRERIVTLMGDIPRVELFARERADGWHSIGNELDGQDIRDVLKDVSAVECHTNQADSPCQRLDVDRPLRTVLPFPLAS
jgi:N6-adenosine-specific RNA methylase IME4